MVVGGWKIIIPFFLQGFDRYIYVCVLFFDIFGVIGVIGVMSRVSDVSKMS